MIILSVGSQENGRKFLSETNLDCLLLCDPERKLFNLFGMGRSAQGSLAVPLLWFYAEEQAKGVILPPYSKGDDIFQIGGNAVLDCVSKKSIYHHVSVNPTDRPSANRLVAIASD